MAQLLLTMTKISVLFLLNDWAAKPVDAQYMSTLELLRTAQLDS